MQTAKTCRQSRRQQPRPPKGCGPRGFGIAIQTRLVLRGARHPWQVRSRVNVKRSKNGPSRISLKCCAGADSPIAAHGGLDLTAGRHARFRNHEGLGLDDAWGQRMSMTEAVGRNNGASWERHTRPRVSMREVHISRSRAPPHPAPPPSLSLPSRAVPLSVLFTIHPPSLPRCKRDTP